MLHIEASDRGRKWLAVGGLTVDIPGGSGGLEAVAGAAVQMHEERSMRSWPGVPGSLGSGSDRRHGTKIRVMLTLTLLGLWAAPAAAQDAERLYQTACERGEASACSVLALMFETGERVSRDLERAAELYGRACELDDMEACTILGSMYHRGEGVTRDLARAVSLHERSCDGGEPIGCESLGLMYEAGTGVIVDYARAAEAYRKACEGELPSGCNRMGMMLQSGTGMAADPAAALELFTRACDGGELVSCVNLGVGYEVGDGAAQDLGAAFVLYEHACDRGEMLGCVNLGSLYRTGRGVAPDARTAASLYRRACEGGEALGCFNLGTSYEGGVGVPQDVVSAVAFFQRSCEAGLEIGCRRLPTGARDVNERRDSGMVATVGRVADAETEELLQDAIVDLPELGIRLRSDENGRVDVPNLPAGRHLIRAEAVGYAVTEGYLRVPGEADFLVLLEPALVSDPGARGRIVGRVTDERGLGLANVDITILNRVAGGTLSNQRGRFLLEGVAPGLAEVRFERLGYEPRTQLIVVQPGRTLDVLVAMSTEPIPLDPIQVVAVRSDYLERSGFYERSLRTWGAQFGPAEIESLLPEQLSDLVRRVNGIVLEGGRGVGAPVRVMSFRRENCQLDIYVDGVRRLSDYNLNEIPPQQVEAVEVYQGLDVPIEFQRVSQTGCGVVLIWTKRGP
jgi:TPR repeat protein